jgi:putative transposase
VADRQPLVRPQRPNEVWSADFVFDRTAEGRVLKCLTIVDDGTTEAVAARPARALGGLAVTRILDQLAIELGLPTILRTDNGPEFCSRAMLTWAHDRGVTLRLIEPGKPTQNAYIESLNGRFRDECLNEHWFTSVPHAHTIIKAWRREYNEERPKKGLGGLTPAAYRRSIVLQQPATHQVRVSAGEDRSQPFGRVNYFIVTRGSATSQWDHLRRLVFAHCIAKARAAKAPFS